MSKSLSERFRHHFVEYRVRPTGEKLVLFVEGYGGDAAPVPYLSSVHGLVEPGEPISKLWQESATATLEEAQWAGKMLVLYDTLGGQLPEPADFYSDFTGLVLRHKGVDVYYTEKYRGDGYYSDTWFSVYPNQERDDDGTFSTDEFWLPDEIDANDEEAIFRYAIDSGQLTDEGWDEDRTNELMEQDEAAPGVVGAD